MPRYAMQKRSMHKLRQRHRFAASLPVRSLTAGLAFALVSPGGPAMAQAAPVVSQPVVQPLPSKDAERLRTALGKLGRDPRDVEALIDAGDAARGLGDYAAAKGFYQRADEAAPGNARAKAGLARVLTLDDDPVAAIAMFAQAEKAGAPASSIAADRGLAYDLVGDNAAAQRSYAAAIGTDADDEVRMRLAVSQAIAGDEAAADATLMPLLRKQDKPAWRTRAFVQAIGGDTNKAVQTANAILPSQLAQNIAPYLRYMPRLTRAQQAAAANLGRFPRASEIGTDPARIAAYVPSPADRLVPRGEPLGTAATGKTVAGKPAAGTTRTALAQRERESSRDAKARRARQDAAAAATRPSAPPEPRPGIVVGGGELPPVAPSPGESRAPAAVASSAPAPAPRAATQGAPARTVAAPAPSRAEAPPASQPSLSEIFADLGRPTAKAVPTSGAVDISRIDPARPAPKVEPKPVEKPKPKKPEPPAHPSRIWVQIGVGRDKDAIAFDWRRYNKQAPALFKGRKAYVSEMGRTNRILAGPFETLKAANAFIADLTKEGITGALPWTSPAGQIVDPLAVK